MALKLNKQQEELANFRKGYCITLASAGAGKSSTILERAKRMVDEGIRPSSILILTFSKKSAQDLKKKMPKGVEGIKTSTFHSLCLQTLYANGIKKDLTVPWMVNKYFTDKYGDDFLFGELLSWISFQKSHMRKPTDEFVEKNTNIEQDLRKLYKEYENFNRSHNFIDFDDMLLEFINLLNTKKSVKDWFANTYEYVMVDEHQDSSRVQNEILKLITGAGNLVAICDIKQNIFTWRGSDLKICLDFQKDWKGAKVIQLPINYRSKKKIVDISNDFIRPDFKDSDLYADAISHASETGNVQISSSITIADKIKKLVDVGIKPSEIAVLYRANYLGGTYEMELREMGVPCTVIEDKPFLERMEIDVIMSYLKLSMDNTDYKSFSGIYNMPNRYLSKKFLKEVSKHSGMKKKNLLNLENDLYLKPHEKRGYLDLGRMVNSIDPMGSPDTQIEFILTKVGLIDHLKHNFDDYEDKINAINLLRRIANKYKTVKQFLYMVQNMNNNKKNEENAVQLMTVHKSKGLEFKYVFVANVDEDMFPHKNAPLEEERRLFYVAITRAIDELYICGNSTFVDEMYDIIKE